MLKKLLNKCIYLEYKLTKEFNKTIYLQYNITKNHIKLEKSYLHQQGIDQQINLSKFINLN